MIATEAAIADYASYPIRHRIERLTIGDGALEVTWDDGLVSPFHFLWLRDNCPCPRCVNPKTREQTFEIADSPEDIRPVASDITAAGALHVQWPGDGHDSTYHPGWLRAHSYDAASRAERRRRSITWGGAMGDRIPTFDAAAVMADNATLHRWLVALRDYGLTLLRGVPTALGSVGQVANRISFIRETNFGVLFDVQSKPDPDSNAYTSLGLPLHTDLPTRELQPGVQFLHCIVHETTGGDSVFVDGFRVAEALRDEAPDDFATLTTMAIEFRNKDRHTDYRFRAPAIGLDADGAIAEVRLANFLRGPFDADPADMPRLYRAYRRFLAMTREPRFQVIGRMTAGDLWAFDNRRVLHARTEFDPTTGRRHLQGCYVDRDELLSRIRVLERAGAMA